MMVDKNLPGPKARERYRAAHKREYIVPPRAGPEARKGTGAPPKTPEAPEAPKVPTPKPTSKRAAAADVAAAPEGPKTKVRRKAEKKRALKLEESEQSEAEAKPPRPSKPKLGKSKVKATTTIPLKPVSDADPDESGTEPISASEDYKLVMKAIYGSSDDSDDERTEPATPTPTKPRRRKS